MKLTPWTKCSRCENYWCVFHDLHVHDCSCPDVVDWGRNPYEELEIEIDMLAITGAPSRPEKLVDMPAFHVERKR